MLWRSASVVCLLLPVLAIHAADDPPARDAIKLKVSPQPLPRPALRYELLPDLREMQPGNPVLGYLKCFGEMHRFYHDPNEVEQREKYLAMPLAEFPAEELKNYGGKVTRYADWAARLDAPDWQTLLPAKAEGIHLLLPELQQLRNLAKVLKVRCRAEAKLGDFAAALGTVKTQFALARHLGQHPTLIGNLVGLAIAAEAAGSLQEILSQPGCPNQFWALRTLPAPFIDLRSGTAAERLLVGVDFRKLGDELEPMDQRRLDKAVALAEEFVRSAQENSERKIEFAAELRARAQDAPGVAAARKLLQDFGAPADQVAKLSPMQVLLLADMRQYEELRDDMVKLLNLDYWRIEDEFIAMTKRLEAAPRAGSLTVLTPALLKVKQAQLRLDQRLAALAVVEALRAHAAAHGGWPKTLAEIKLPLPIDPVSGKPFTYRVEGDQAVLENALPKLIISKAFPFRMELTLAK